MNRAQYEVGRAIFRLLCRVQREVPLNVAKHGRLRVLQRHPLARQFAQLVLRLERTDPLSVPLTSRLYWFKLEKDGLPF